MITMRDLVVILFDLDGVLLDTISSLKQAYKDVAQYLGIKPPTGEALNWAVQVGPQKALGELFPEEDNSKAKAVFNRYWRANIDSVSCFAGVTELLMALSYRKVMLGTVTSRNSSDTYSLLDAARIRSYMQTVVTWGHYRVPKPSPACLTVALQKTGKPPNKTAYVGDQAKDVLAAKSAGVLAVGAIWDVNASKDDLRNAGADVIAEEPMEILQLVTTGKISNRRQ